jgi:hypothetical protein
MRQLDFIADEPGDWAIHCHKSHHTMNPMGHDMPNLIGVEQQDLARKLNEVIPGYMAMGSTGMAEMGEMHMTLPNNTAPMMTGKGPFGSLEMGGMFTVLKVRDDQAPGDYSDPGWYSHPPGTVAWEYGGTPVEPARAPHVQPSKDTLELQVKKPGASKSMQGHHHH